MHVKLPSFPEEDRNCPSYTFVRLALHVYSDHWQATPTPPTPMDLWVVLKMTIWCYYRYMLLYVCMYCDVINALVHTFIVLATVTRCCTRCCWRCRGRMRTSRWVSWWLVCSPSAPTSSPHTCPPTRIRCGLKSSRPPGSSGWISCWRYALCVMP